MRVHPLRVSFILAVLLVFAVSAFAHVRVLSKRVHCRRNSALHHGGADREGLADGANRDHLPGCSHYCFFW